jgi:hypothetical protein
MVCCDVVLCRFLEAVPRVEQSVLVLLEADERYLKKQRGIIADNAQALERISGRLKGVREGNLAAGKPADAATDKITAADDLVKDTLTMQKRLEDADPPLTADVHKFVQAVAR